MGTHDIKYPFIYEGESYCTIKQHRDFRCCIILFFLAMFNFKFEESTFIGISSLVINGLPTKYLSYYTVLLGIPFYKYTRLILNGVCCLFVCNICIWMHVCKCWKAILRLSEYCLFIRVWGLTRQYDPFCAIDRCREYDTLNCCVVFVGI